MQKVLEYILNHKDLFVPAGVSAGSLAALAADINIYLKVLVTAATLTYFVIRIYKEIKR